MVSALRENEIVKHDNKSILKILENILSQSGRKFITKTS